MIYLLDTDQLSLWGRATAEGIRIRERVKSLPPDDYGITVITYAEQAKGWLAEVARARTPMDEVESFAELHQSLKFCTSFAIWGYTTQAAELCAQSRHAKVRIGTQDVRIASIALVNGATLLTRNTRDFSRVPGLPFADWSV